MTDVVAEIAARYGAAVAPGVTVTRVPLGQSSRPLPVWDGARLVNPDWKTQAEAQRRTAIRNAARARRKSVARDAEFMQRLCDLHDAGARVPAMAAALGVSGDYVYQLLAQIGRRMERDPAQQDAAARRMIAGRKAMLDEAGRARDEMIRGLAAKGATEPQIAAALGITDKTWCRKLIRRAVPDFAFERLRKGPAPKPLQDRVKARKRADRATRNAGILGRHEDGETVEAIVAAMSLSRAVVVRVLRRAGHQPRFADRAGADAQAVRSARAAELPGLIASGLTTPLIAKRWGKSVKYVHGIASRTGVSLRPTMGAPHNKGAVSLGVAARRARIVEMVGRRMTDAEMCAVLGVHPSTLAYDIKVLGLTGARPRGGVRRPGGDRGSA